MIESDVEISWRTWRLRWRHTDTLIVLARRNQRGVDKPFNTPHEKGKEASPVPRSCVEGMPSSYREIVRESVVR
jgi:hypothetical protein